MNQVQEICLPRSMPKVLGMGAHLKASLCLIDGDRAIVTRTAGDMETLEAVEDYQDLMADMLERAGGAQSIACAAHDLHPNFHTTTFAADLGCRTLAVQHHHAHTLATVLEHALEGPVLGLSLDGFGLGPNDQSWGGELLWVDGLDFERIGHLSLLAQPGGDIAAREPWRMGAAALHGLGRGGEIAERFADWPHAQLLGQMLDKGINSPVTSSCGRLFDAACGLLGVCPVAEFEGQAPMALEALATQPYVIEGGWSIDDGGRLDLSSLLQALTTMDAGEGANAFHGTLAAALADWVVRAGQVRGVHTVAYGGGCFLNAVLSERLTQALQGAGVKVLRPERLSPGDAGLSFGQAYAAALKVERAAVEQQERGV
ncbi:hydrogenase maturation protein HypF [Pseudomonadota bacterium]